MTSKKSETAAEREKRLAQALRANLKRRKAQSRGKTDAPGAASKGAAEEKNVNEPQDD